MGYTKNRLIEMMEKVGGTKVTINESTERGTTIDIRDVSPETIEIGQQLPSLEQGDVSTSMSRPNQIIWWKNEFIQKYGNRGQLVLGKSLPKLWDVVGNRDFEIWQTGSLSAKQNWIDQDKAAGRHDDYGLGGDEIGY